ncbi:MAG: hypothetical protein MZV70_08640 [Desulfobacterales bacterium]|nr:hypothetical protein [Desulfobacterales bacterium]
MKSLQPGHSRPRAGAQTPGHLEQLRLQRGHQGGAGPGLQPLRHAPGAARHPGPNPGRLFQPPPREELQGLALQLLDPRELQIHVVADKTMPGPEGRRPDADASKRT